MMKRMMMIMAQWRGPCSPYLMNSCFSLPQRLDHSLRCCTPWMLLHGSGGITDFLCDVLKDLQSLTASTMSPEGEGLKLEQRNRVREWLKKHLPLEKEVEKLTERVRASAGVGWPQTIRVLCIQSDVFACGHMTLSASPPPFCPDPQNLSESRPDHHL